MRISKEPFLLDPHTPGELTGPAHGLGATGPQVNVQFSDRF